MTTIVVGVDGSEPSRAALRWGLTEAQLRGCNLLALHVYRAPIASIDFALAYLDLRGPAADLLATEVAKALADTGMECRVTQAIEEGHAGASLVRHAGDDAIIVVGHRGHGVVAGALLGSTSQYVAKHAHCPVIIVRDGSS